MLFLIIPLFVAFVVVGAKRGIRNDHLKQVAKIRSLRTDGITPHVEAVNKGVVDKMMAELPAKYHKYAEASS
jgi:hypothetical protein